MADLNELYGSNAITQLLEKDEFLCIRRTYFLLYQSLMPNCKVTIAILRQHCEITSDVEQYILNSGSARLCCQQLFNFLLVRLDRSKDYMEFCKFLRLTSILSAEMMSEFQKSIFWGFKPQLDTSHGKKYEVVNSVRLQSDKLEVASYQTMNCDTVEAITFYCLSARCYCEASEDKACNVSDVLIGRRLIKFVNVRSSTPPLHKEVKRIKEDVTDTNIRSSSRSSSDTGADKGVFYNETFRNLTLPSNSKGIVLLEKHYSTFCHCLPQDNMITVTRPMHVTDESIAHLSNPKIINERIVADMIMQIKTEEDILEFCDQFEHLVDPASRALVEKFRDEVLTMLTTPDDHDSPQSLPASSTPEIEPQVNGRRDNSTVTVTTVQPTSGDTTVGVTLEYFRADCKGNERPTLRDVCRHVVPNYAHKWRYLGDQLHFSEAELGIIFNNSCNDSEKCCRDLMSRWLNKNSNATWDQLLTAIDNLSEFTCTAMKFQQPPVLPPNYIARHKLLEELVSAVMKAKLEPNRFGATITITGVGGFGKSILAKALCHHDTIKAKFSGFVLVELGPKSFDPVVELHQLYYQLTGKEFPTNQSNNPNIIVNEIRQVTIKHSDKLLVIIDDVWHVEDAEPIVEAFNNCKIIITTRENEISRWIPCKYSIIAGPMEPHEAISLLIDGVVLQTLLSENDHTLLDNIAHDVHLWPLLLSLVRGQFSHYIVDQHLPFKTAIGMIHQKLYAKGLTAFDRENVSNNIIKRKYAVKACIETTLDLLKGSDSLRMKVMVLFSGIGSTIPTIALHIIWKTSHLEANDTLSNLWGHGLVSYGSTIIPRYGVEQRHVEVHATISQFIIETLQTDEVSLLSVNFDKNIGVSFGKAVCEEFYRCYGLADPTSMSHEIILIHHLGSFEYFLIPYCLRFVNAWAVLDPYIFNSSILQMMLEMLTTCTLGYPEDITSTFSSQVNNLINDCQKIVIGLCSKKSLYQLSMKHLTEKNYDELLQELEDYHKQYPLGVIIERSVKLTKNFMVYCKDDHSLYSFCQSLLAGIYELTGPAHPNNVMIPAITLIVDVCKKIENCLKSNTEIKETAENLTQILENGMELIKEQYQIKELVPDFMCI